MFAQRLKGLLKKKDISETKFACDLQISPLLLGAWEAQEISPDIQAATKIADYFDVSLDYLVGRSDDPKRH